MIHVEQIKICEFRGIRNLTINFKGENFAICGPNGTGKSGVVDALEFALTGSISRLSGRGTGGISVKEHAPHVDCRNAPNKAYVILSVSIPSLSKKAIIKRSVRNPLVPMITPDDPDILAVLNQVSIHPEFALSRRELIRYVISAPGDRAKEVQALLRLNEIEELRSVFQKIANASQRAIPLLKGEKQRAEEQLLRALDISDLNQKKLLEAVNLRRLLLGLGPITVLTPTTSLRDGLVTTVPAAQPNRIPKIQALADVKKLRETLTRITDAKTVALCESSIKKLTALSTDPRALNDVTREQFLQSALTFIDDEKFQCPVCDTPWDPTELKGIVSSKLGCFEEVRRKRTIIETELEPLCELIEELSGAMEIVEKYGAALVPAVDTKVIKTYRSDISDKRKLLKAILPLADTISALEKITEIEEDLTITIVAIETAISAIPDPTQQDAARDYLTVCQERLKTFRGVAIRHKRAEDRASLTRKISDTYAKVSTDTLNEIYKEVEKDFSDLYCFIHREDEGNFTAHLTPSLGKLGFDVDFYGRGFFPPGAYHSEGHQDGMGVCLYLALMKHLLGDAFAFAVLDDVLMSVDSGHRREVCNLLKDRFPNTQFILTTHDEIWLRHMKTAGLVFPHAFRHFRKWDVDQGPTEWSEREVWDDIDADLGKNDVRAAAALLRHYLEFISAEACHRLRAPVEFRGDAQFQLGDLLPSVVGRLSKLLKEGRAAAQSWKQTAEVESITVREAEFRTRVEKSQVEQWQINPAVHYNEWATLQASDFTPVVVACRELIGSLCCPDCKSLLYVLPERGQRETLRCSCGLISINLKRNTIKKAQNHV